MRWAIVLVVGVAIGLALSYLADRSENMGDQPTPVLITKQIITQEALPDAVERTRTALLKAGEASDYDALRKLIPESGFTYTFGGPFEGGPIAYWQELERTTGERPLAILGAVLQAGYVESDGLHVWPLAYEATKPADLSAFERDLLAPLGDVDKLFVPGAGYLGWRTGIAPDGTWTFFVAGD